MVICMYQYIQIFISDDIFNIIILNHHELATLPVKSWPHYPILGITLYTLYNNVILTKINVLHILL